MTAMLRAKYDDEFLHVPEGDCSYGFEDTGEEEELDGAYLDIEKVSQKEFNMEILAHFKNLIREQAVQPDPPGHTAQHSSDQLTSRDSSESHLPLHLPGLLRHGPRHDQIRLRARQRGDQDRANRTRLLSIRVREYQIRGVRAETRQELPGRGGGVARQWPLLHRLATGQ
jgi:hypothetical protein